ncbi:MAG: class I SAM-dependent methyltransferase [Planctomycetota bacterium]|nr:class I SAM-dependent methyltransferase [Planctomycetota bacterium]MDA1142195.1 class I SAM-dependent methyltransferase [Planctomycetota bacterium]
MSYIEQNKAAWKRLSRSTRIATDEECRNPMAALDPRGWLPDSVGGLNVLCLASGGGRQSILYALAGAKVTVVDVSPAMLQLDLREAKKRDVQIKTVCSSMEDLPTLENGSFDIVHHPVSTCYVPDLTPVYKEVARLLKDYGIYIGQHKQPTNLQIAAATGRGEYCLGVEYYHRGPLPDAAGAMYREKDATEYLHRWEDLIGGLCRAGLWIEDLREPYWGDPSAPPGLKAHRCRYTAPYVRVKARRRPRTGDDGKRLVVS